MVSLSWFLSYYIVNCTLALYLLALIFFLYKYNFNVSLLGAFESLIAEFALYKWINIKFLSLIVISIVCKLILKTSLLQNQ